MAGRNKDTRKPKGKKPLSNGWIVVPSKTYPDRVYFYNTVTRCSTWNNPCEDGTDEESNNSTAEETHAKRNCSFRTKRKPVQSYSRKQKSETTFSSMDTNSNIRINSEIEDYDDHDAYFSDNLTNVFNNTHSHVLSPPSSPDSVSSFRTNISDADNLLIESNKKQLWTHFISSPDKPKVRKSVALSDFQEASTSHNSEMKKFSESDNKNIKNFVKNKKKKRKKRQTESEKKSTVGKINKNISFKKSDKTPSQTRLLELRKQNADKLKELAAKCPELGIKIDGHSKNKNKNSSVLDSGSLTEFRGSCSKQSVFGSAIQGTDNSVDYSEEMDWEPSSEESDVRNINEFRQQLDRPKEVFSDNFFGLNSEHPSVLPSKANSWLVLDTNIFVSCLPFVRELRDTKVTDLGYPIIYVPWRVLQELDHLKNTKLDSMDRNLLMNVRRAISYLNDNFKSRHPRIFGQSFADFEQMMDFSASDFAPDDEILQTCIQLQKQHGDKKLMLLTNDKNLESKAIVSGVEVYSKERFQKKYLKSNSVSSQFTPSCVLNKSNTGGADDCLCQVKVILKDFLTVFVETEMRIAFDRDWIKVAVKKPPWSLEDVMKCLLKHWRSVFFLNFSKDTHSDVELLNDQLFKREAVSTDDVAEIIKTIQRLLISINKSQKKARPYVDVIPNTMSKLNDLLRILTSNQPDVDFSFPSVSGSSFNPQQITQNESSSSDISRAKILFKEIWDSLRNFCCSISDVIHSSGPNTEAVVQEMRLKLSQVLNEVGELVLTIEKILEINPSEISELHPVIIHLSNFLSLVYPNMVPHLKNELPRCLATFFTDFEGRSLISISLKDFKEFIQDLTKAAEYFNAQYSC